MTEPQVDAALCVNSPALVAEVYETTRRSVDNYNLKLGRLDAKATTLLGAVTLSLTVAFTYGGDILLTQREKLKLSGSTHVYVTLGFLGAAIVAGVVAGVSAAYALLVADHAEVSDHAVYNAKELQEADADPGDAAEQAKGLASYRRAVTLHLWGIAKQREEKARVKALAIKRGQYCLLVFLAFLLCVCVEILTRMA